VKLRRSFLMITLAIATTIALSPRAFAQPAVDGPVTIAVHVSLAPTWFDPAETPGVITPFLTRYALHDALVKPMSGNAFAPSLAESWTASKDGLSYEFVLAADAREGDVRADRGAGAPDRRRATAGRAADDHGTSLHLAVRGPEAEGTVTS